MASENGRTDPSLEQTLYNEGYRFEFFQAVRLLKRLYPDRGQVGQGTNPADETVRFRAHVSLSFPPSTIQGISASTNGTGPVDMKVAFMGLTGPQGVLPLHYTELLLERARKKDFAFQDFFDLFNHRIVSLFYRAWEKYHFVVGYERSVRHGEPLDRFSQYLFDLIGMGTKGHRGRFAFEDRSLLFYTGLLAQRPRSATALESLLSDYFDVPVKVNQSTGQWLDLSKEHCCRLGDPGASSRLGVTAVLGTQVWDQQAKFRVVVGPLHLSQFTPFLPSNRAFLPLIQWIRFFVGQELDFDVQLRLEAAEVPECRLGAIGRDAPRLGWSAWLKTRDFTKDADDCIFPGEAAFSSGMAPAAA
jgi:type VI secretion system protein ImpH